MEEKAILILDALKHGTRVEFSKLLINFRERSHGVMTFLAGLELTRRRLLFLRQTRPFSELWIYRREDAPEDENALVFEEDENLSSVAAADDTDDERRTDMNDEGADA